MHCFTVISSTPVHQCTLHQGFIENTFISDMKTRGLAVDRPTIPTSIQVAACTEKGMANADGVDAHPVKVYAIRTHATFQNLMIAHCLHNDR